MRYIDVSAMILYEKTFHSNIWLQMSLLLLLYLGLNSFKVLSDSFFQKQELVKV